ncbi:unnamed protein product, partial [Mesorhabditis belari]|uniref:Uncharacterized protein n=1 Tax=Mesorhabditis belari TaxID=2138241 RepID=A0AAF3F935_9BILA
MKDFDPFSDLLSSTTFAPFFQPTTEDYDSRDHLDIPCANFSGYCVLTWECMNVDRYPFTGLVLNQIISGINIGMGVSMTMLGSGISMNRFFAVYFDGLLYYKMQKLALPHATFLTAMPVGVYLAQLVLTHLIAIGFYAAKKLMTDTRELPIFYYLFLELTPFLMHSALGLVVIIFNLPSKKEKTTAISSIITPTS